MCVFWPIILTVVIVYLIIWIIGSSPFILQDLIIGLTEHKKVEKE